MWCESVFKTCFGLVLLQFFSMQLSIFLVLAWQWKCVTSQLIGNQELCVSFANFTGSIFLFLKLSQYLFEEEHVAKLGSFIKGRNRAARGSPSQSPRRLLEQNWQLRIGYLTCSTRSIAVAVSVAELRPWLFFLSHVWVNWLSNNLAYTA